MKCCNNCENPDFCKKYGICEVEELENELLHSNLLHVQDPDDLDDDMS